jgi:hypothetical protein
VTFETSETLPDLPQGRPLSEAEADKIALLINTSLPSQLDIGDMLAQIEGPTGD